MASPVKIILYFNNRFFKAFFKDDEPKYISVNLWSNDTDERYTSHERHWWEWMKNELHMASSGPHHFWENVGSTSWERVDLRLSRPQFWGLTIIPECSLNQLCQLLGDAGILDSLLLPESCPLCQKGWDRCNGSQLSVSGHQGSLHVVIASRGSVCSQVVGVTQGHRSKHRPLQAGHFLVNVLCFWGTCGFMVPKQK